MYKTGDSVQRLVAFNNSQSINDLASLRCEWRTEMLPKLEAKTVRIAVHYSSMNYKDALAITGKGKILRTLPLTPGIDACGTVVSSLSTHFSEGDEVLVTGCGLGESIDGGLSQVIDAPESWVIRKPQNLSLKDTMILGTAGFTAGLALHQLEHNGLFPEPTKPVLITGATGGVGSLSLLMLKQKGYTVEAWTRKESTFLQTLAADKVINMRDLLTNTRFLESSTWSACIDNVGGDILSYILPRMAPHSGVAAIGLAKSAELHTSVFPFILRGVNLLGISSSTCPRPLREIIWQEISAMNCNWTMCLQNTLKPKDVLSFAQDMIAGKTFGRSIVEFI